MPHDKNTERNKVIFCTYSSVYSSIVLEKLLADDAINVVGVIHSTRLHHPQFGQIRGAIKQIQLSGWRYSTYLFLITDIFSWLQPLFVRKTVKHLANINQIPFMSTRDINQADGIAFIKNSSADILLAAHFNQLIKPEILEQSKLHCINIHPSKLPAYKGVDPAFFAHFKGEETVGVSLHKMEEKFDTGAILNQKELTLNPTDSVYELNKKLFLAGAELATEWIKNTKKNDESIMQTKEDSYDSWPSPEQIKQFRFKGKKLITLKELLNE